MEQTTNETAQAVDSTVPDTQAINEQASTESAEQMLELPSISYDDVLTKIALRHGQAQVDEALKLAIAQEQQAHVAAYQAWELEVVEVEAQRQAALAHNANLAADSDEQVAVPELPEQPQIDMSLRRACYRKEYVEVDLALTTEQKPARTEYDDEALVAYIYPATQAHSQAQIAQVKRERFKQARKQELAQLTVKVDDMEFDADELSQQRMARALLVMEDGDNTPWVLANNEVAQVSKTQLFNACKLASVQQTELWVSQ
ncbi:hypothetical protein PA25_19240 [Pseudoalteromonas sp. A25]|uniref:DUF4376 domain-containing protein n=1 Tax=Pseudoalteromonas sp. A25 TaxID=116092 RepID=UPI001260490D|nr:hypothetical protein [Pseudoalteromonas sp. A25]BBN81939.1 hypothetical protein PA25_19240 [Pseudoalteromonas sp. A25]